MSTVSHTALVTAPASPLGSAASPRDPRLPRAQVGKAGGAAPSPWGQGWFWAVLVM